MKLGDFSKGKNIRLDPSLIELNEGVVYSNIDNTSGLLVSAKTYTPTTQVIQSWFYLFNTEWYSTSQSLERDYIEYRRKLYFTEKNSDPKKVIGDIVKPIGIAAPSTKLAGVEGSAGDLLADDYVYTYTYYDSSEGVESPPAPISDEITIGASKSTDLTGFVPTTNPFVDIIRLYRTGGGATEFTLIVELPYAATVDAGTYTDDTATLDAIGSILDSTTYQPPISNLRNLVQAYGILFASLGSDLYFTVTGKPDAWPAVNKLPFANEITGILPIQDGILVFTDERGYLLLGNDPSNFAISDLTIEQGCNSHKSCKVCNGIPVWSSKYGICSYQGGSATVVSRDKLGKITLSIVNTAVYDGQYYACLTDGSLVAMDMRFGLCFKDYDLKTVDITDIGVFDNVLYAVIAGKVVTLFDNDPLELNYVSPELTEGDHTQTKMYNNIYIKANGSFTIKILIDTKVVAIHYIAGPGIFDLTVPEEQQRGSVIQFDIKGIGTVKEIEYKVVGRQNGR